MIEPLELLIGIYNFETDRIKEIVSGVKYTAVLLNNGNIGVCANLGNKINTQINTYSDISLDDFSHRIVLTAYFNALLNCNNKFSENGDIFEKVNFKKYRHIVMIGLFKPIVKIFQENRIPLFVFDYRKSETLITSNSEQEQHIKEADAIILTATSIFNSTFLKIITDTNSDCKIFILGPSSIMTKELFQYRNIEMIFGSTFQSFDDRVLEVIENDGGTRKFLKYGKKRVFEK